MTDFSDYDKESKHQVTPHNEREIVLDRLNNILTGVALKSGVLRSKVHDDSLHSALKEIEELALVAVQLVRQL